MRAIGSLVDPDLQARLLRLRAGLDHRRQLHRPVGVGARVRQEQKRHYSARDRPTITINARTRPPSTGPDYPRKSMIRYRARQGPRRMAGAAGSASRAADDPQLLANPRRSVNST